MKQIVKVFPLFTLCATAATLTAQTLTTLHSFDGTDGTGPFGALIQATNGDLYGTTERGGAGSAMIRSAKEVPASGLDQRPPKDLRRGGHSRWPAR